MALLGAVSNGHGKDDSDLEALRRGTVECTMLMSNAGPCRSLATRGTWSTAACWHQQNG